MVLDFALVREGMVPKEKKSYLVENQKDGFLLKGLLLWCNTTEYGDFQQFG